jgi:WD40 repeat protein
VLTGHECSIRSLLVWKRDYLISADSSGLIILWNATYQNIYSYRPLYDKITTLIEWEGDIIVGSKEKNTPPLLKVYRIDLAQQQKLKKTATLTLPDAEPSSAIVWNDLLWIMDTKGTLHAVTWKGVSSRSQSRNFSFSANFLT